MFAKPSETEHETARHVKTGPWFRDIGAKLQKRPA